MTKVLNRQSVFDVALKTSGGIDAAFSLAEKNGISISDAITPGTELETAQVADKLVLSRYEAQKITPATDVSPDDIETVPCDGIGLMSVEIDFTVI